MNGGELNDDFDDLALGDALRRIAGPGPDADAALPGLYRRVRIARMRRVSTFAASVAIVAATGTAIGLTAGRGTDRIGPSDVPATLPDDSTVSDDSGTATSNPSGVSGYDNDSDDDGTSSAATPGGSTMSTAPQPGGGGTSGTNPGSGSTPPSSTTTTTIDDGGDDDGRTGTGEGGDRGDESDRGEGRNRPITAAPHSERRCTSSAGSFTAVFDGTTSATLIVPAAGYRVHEVEEEADVARVIFRTDESEVVVEARWSGSLFVCATPT